MKTIRQIAEELGVTKQAVSKRLPLLPPTATTTNQKGTILINAGGEAILKSMIAPKPPTNATTKPPTKPTTENNSQMLELQHKIEMLELEIKLKTKSYKEKIEILDRELCRKNDIISEQLKALSETHAMINNAQLLHGGTISQQLTTGEVPADGRTVPKPPKRNIFDIFKKQH